MSSVYPPYIVLSSTTYSQSLYIFPLNWESSFPLLRKGYMYKCKQ